MIEINKVIFKTLDDAGIKCYPIVAPENTPLPFVVYERSLTQAVTKDGRSINTATINIYVLSDDYKTTLNISGQIDDLLQPIQGQQLDSYIFNTSLISIDELFDSGIYVQKMIYEIKMGA